VTRSQRRHKGAYSEVCERTHERGSAGYTTVPDRGETRDALRAQGLQWELISEIDLSISALTVAGDDFGCCSQLLRNDFFRTKNGPASGKEHLFLNPQERQCPDDPQKSFFRSPVRSADSMIAQSVRSSRKNG
jgi:hypothetical protein